VSSPFHYSQLTQRQHNMMYQSRIFAFKLDLTVGLLLQVGGINAAEMGTCMWFVVFPTFNSIQCAVSTEAVLSSKTLLITHETAQYHSTMI